MAESRLLLKFTTNESISAMIENIESYEEVTPENLPIILNQPDMKERLRLLLKYYKPPSEASLKIVNEGKVPLYPQKPNNITQIAEEAQEYSISISKLLNLDQVQVLQVYISYLCYLRGKRSKVTTSKEKKEGASEEAESPYGVETVQGVIIFYRSERMALLRILRDMLRIDLTPDHTDFHEPISQIITDLGPEKIFDEALDQYKELYEKGGNIWITGKEEETKEGDVSIDELIFFKNKTKEEYKEADKDRFLLTFKKQWAWQCVDEQIILLEILFLIQYQRLNLDAGRTLKMLNIFHSHKFSVNYQQALLLPPLDDSRFLQKKFRNMSILLIVESLKLSNLTVQDLNENARNHFLENKMREVLREISIKGKSDKLAVQLKNIEQEINELNTSFAKHLKETALSHSLLQNYPNCAIDANGVLFQINKVILDIQREALNSASREGEASQGVLLLAWGTFLILAHNLLKSDSKGLIEPENALEFCRRGLEFGAFSFLKKIVMELDPVNRNKKDDFDIISSYSIEEDLNEYRNEDVDIMDEAVMLPASKSIAKELFSAAIYANPALSEYSQLIPLATTIYRDEKDLAFEFWNTREPCKKLLESMKFQFPERFLSLFSFLSSLIADSDSAQNVFDYLEHFNYFTSSVPPSDIISGLKKQVRFENPSDTSPSTCTLLKDFNVSGRMIIPAGTSGEIINKQDGSTSVRWNFRYPALPFVFKAIESDMLEEGKISPYIAEEMSPFFAMLNAMLRCNPQICFQLKKYTSLDKLVDMLKDTLFKFNKMTLEESENKMKSKKLSTNNPKHENYYHGISAYCLGALTNIAFVEPGLVLDAIIGGKATSHFSKSSNKEVFSVEMINNSRNMLHYECNRSNYPITLATLRLLERLVRYAQRRFCSTDYRHHFKRYDINRCGRISLKSFYDALDALEINISIDLLSELVIYLNANSAPGSTDLNYIEFLCQHVQGVSNTLGLNLNTMLGGVNSPRTRRPLGTLEQISQALKHVTMLPLNKERFFIDQAVTLCGEVFANYENWTYSNREEQWLIGLRCVRIMNLILSAGKMEKVENQSVRSKLIKNLFSDASMQRALLSACCMLSISAFAPPSSSLNSNVSVQGVIPVDFNKGLIGSTKPFPRETRFIKNLCSESLMTLEILLATRNLNSKTSGNKEVWEAATKISLVSRDLELPLWYNSVQNLATENSTFYSLNKKKTVDDVSWRARASFNHVVAIAAYLDFPHHKSSLRIQATRILSLLARISAACSAKGEHPTLMAFLGCDGDAVRESISSLFSFKEYTENLNCSVLSLICTVLETQPSLTAQLFYHFKETKSPLGEKGSESILKLGNEKLSPASLLYKAYSIIANNKITLENQARTISAALALILQLWSRENRKHHFRLVETLKQTDNFWKYISSSLLVDVDTNFELPLQDLVQQSGFEVDVIGFNTMSQEDQLKIFEKCTTHCHGLLARSYALKIISIELYKQRTTDNGFSEMCLSLHERYSAWLEQYSVFNYNSHLNNIIEIAAKQAGIDIKIFRRPVDLSETLFPSFGDSFVYSIDDLMNVLDDYDSFTSKFLYIVKLANCSFSLMEAQMALLGAWKSFVEVTCHPPSNKIHLVQLSSVSEDTTDGNITPKISRLIRSSNSTASRFKGDLRSFAMVCELAEKLSSELEEGFPMARAQQEMSQLFVSMLHHQLYEVTKKMADPRQTKYQRRDYNRIKLEQRQLVSNALEKSVRRILNSKFKSELDTSLLSSLLSGFVLLWAIEPDGKESTNEAAVIYSSCMDIKSKMLHHAMEIISNLDVSQLKNNANGATTPLHRTTLSLISLIILKWDIEDVNVELRYFNENGWLSTLYNLHRYFSETVVKLNLFSDANEEAFADLESVTRVFLNLSSFVEGTQLLVENGIISNIMNDIVIEKMKTMNAYDNNNDNSMEVDGPSSFYSLHNYWCDNLLLLTNCLSKSRNDRIANKTVQDVLGFISKFLVDLERALRLTSQFHSSEVVEAKRVLSLIYELSHHQSKWQIFSKHSHKVMDSTIKDLVRDISLQLYEEIEMSARAIESQEESSRIEVLQILEIAVSIIQITTIMPLNSSEEPSNPTVDFTYFDAEKDKNVLSVSDLLKACYVCSKNGINDSNRVLAAVLSLLYSNLVLIDLILEKHRSEFDFLYEDAADQMQIADDIKRKLFEFFKIDDNAENRETYETSNSFVWLLVKNCVNILENGIFVRSQLLFDDHEMQDSSNNRLTYSPFSSPFSSFSSSTPGMKAIENRR